MYKIIEPKIFRENIVIRFNKLLEDNIKSINLEKGIFNYSIKEATICKVVKNWDNQYFVLIYTTKLRSIISNFKKIMELLKEDNTLKAEQIPFMTHQEIDSIRWEELITAKMKRDKNICETQVEASSDLFKCGKCKERRTVFYEMQTRSADEPMTIFITCLNCGKRWRQ